MCYLKNWVDGGKNFDRPRNKSNARQNERRKLSIASTTKIAIENRSCRSDMLLYIHIYLSHFRFVNKIKNVQQTFSWLNEPQPLKLTTFRQKRNDSKWEFANELAKKSVQRQSYSISKRFDLSRFGSFGSAMWSDTQTSQSHCKSSVYSRLISIRVIPFRYVFYKCQWIFNLYKFDSKFCIILCHITHYNGRR